MDRKIKTNAMFNLLYQIVAIILPLITMPYISRVLGVDNIGIQSYTLSIVSYFMLFAAFGLNDYGQREVARNRNDKIKVSQLFTEIFANRLLTSILILTVYLSLTFTVFEVDYKIYYLILTLNILSVTFDVTWFFQGIEKFKVLAIRNSIIKVLATIFVFVFVKNEGSLWIYVLINSCSLIFSSLSIWTVVPKYIKKTKIQICNVFKHYKGAMVYFIPAIAVQIYTILDKTMIQWITGSTLENGVYEQAEKLGKISLIIIQLMNSIMVSRMSYLYEINDYENAKKLCNSSMNFFSLLVYPMLLGVVLIAPNLIPFYLGPGYEKSILLLQIFSLLILFIGISGFIGSHYMTPVGKQNKSNIALIFGAIVNFILNIILIKKYSAIGAAIASVCAEGLIAILYMYNARKFIKPIFFVKNGYKNIIAAIIMFLVTFFSTKYMVLSDFFMLLVKISISVLTYFVILVLLQDSLIISSIKKFYNVVKKLIK